jgi:hypothetical protein
MNNEELIKKYSTTFVLFIVTLISLHALTSYFYVEDVRLGFPPDELAHLSKIASTNTASLIPKPTSEYICTISGGNTSRLNYLSHPPLYYLINSLITDKQGCEVVYDYKKFRVLTLIFSVASLVVLVVGLRLITSSDSGMAMYLLFVTSIPIFPYISAATNNDILAFLAFSLLIVSLSFFLSGRYIRSSIILISFSLAICLLTKSTTGLQAILLTAITLIISYKYALKQCVSNVKTLVLAVAILMFPVCYYILVKLNFGTFLPSTVSIAESYWKKQPATLDIFQYFSYYWEITFKTFTGIASHNSVYKTHVAHAFGLIVATLISFSQIFSKPIKTELIIIWKIYISGIITFCIFTIVHFIFVYGKYRTFGYPGGIQFRYFISLMPVIGLGYLLWHVQAKKWLKIASAVILIPSLLWGNIYYYLDNRVAKVETKSKVPSLVKISGHATVTYKDNSVFIKGSKYNCSESSDTKIVGFYNEMVYAIKDIGFSADSFEFNVPMPLNCRQYTDLLKNIKIMQFCVGQKQHEFTLQDAYHCIQ